jgi:hypothetical protein
MDIDDRIAGMYAAFNRRDIDGLMALLSSLGGSRTEPGPTEHPGIACPRAVGR